jgi:tripartite ATP-independent transporter DctM subunit
MGITMMITVAYFAHKRNYGRDAKFSAVKLLKASLEIVTVACVPGSAWLLFKLGMPGGWAVILSFAVLLLLDKLFSFSAVMALLTPVMLIGGMTMGVFTPTEGAIAASMWALFLGLVWYRTLDWRRLVKITMDTIETTATVLFIVAAASIFGWLLTVTRVTDAVAEWVLAFSSNPNVFLLLANLLLLFVGCFLEPTAAITLLVPILVPICQKLGIDLVHFGLVMVLNLMIGLLHPPMGTVLFVLSRVAKLSIERTTVAILPWLVPLLLTLGLCTYVPSIVLWLPKQFF